MKRLILVRHGKSSWKHDLPDAERPVLKRAYQDAEIVLKAFESFMPTNLHMWSSPALRAITTAKIFQKELQVSTENFFEKEGLYTFDANNLMKEISDCDDAVHNLMIFGHNPALTQMANRLGDQIFSNIPTTGLCLLEFESASWKSLKNGKTLLYLFPKNLR